ncbi:permease [Actibacterium mucosum KCTC 23349]|uniref:Permease n=1 Tax=Actibacterium mucosum KCTC 23349 TaxID=1454373 RepID=A0A037ZGN1_9RHOB|nr:LPS export ABC transporter permease LptG [Actibacterium mucosum]KAJ55620.1 permease [Actibacterium mucosum KCTC 23349]
MKLHMYFARKFLLTLLSVLAVFLLFLLMLDVVDQLRQFGGGEISSGQALQLSLLSVPTALYQILPLVVLLATLALYLSLARTSELVVSRAAGRSALRSLAAPVIAILVVGAFSVGVLNPMVAATSKQYEVQKSTLSVGTPSVLSLNRGGLWMRQGNADGQVVLRAARSNLDGTSLFDVTIVAFAPDAGPIYRIQAASAELGDGMWLLSEVKRWELAAEVTNPEQGATTHATMSLPTDLTRDRIRDSFGAPSAIPVWELPAFIEALERAGFSAQRHRVWLQMELALPLVFVAMVLIAAGFTMRHTRFGRTGVMVLMALGMGLALFFLRSFAQVLGENGQIPVALAAWAPPVIAIFLSLGVVLHLEDG